MDHSDYLRTGLTPAHTAPSMCLTYTGVQAERVVLEQNGINAGRRIAQRATFARLTCYMLRQFDAAEVSHASH
jgi:hypothetical protein